MRSLRKCLGLLTWNLRPCSWKKRTEIISAIDEEEVGCPVLVTLTAREASILIWLPMSSQSEKSSCTCYFSVILLKDILFVTFNNSSLIGNECLL